MSDNTTGDPLRRGFPRSGEGFGPVDGRDYQSEADYDAQAGCPKSASGGTMRTNVPPEKMRPPVAPEAPSIFSRVIAAGTSK